MKGLNTSNCTLTGNRFMERPFQHFVRSFVRFVSEFWRSSSSIYVPIGDVSSPVTSIVELDPFAFDKFLWTFRYGQINFPDFYECLRQVYFDPDAKEVLVTFVPGKKPGRYIFSKVYFSILEIQHCPSLIQEKTFLFLHTYYLLFKK